ncbi:cytochrome P450 [Poronia punctata]|nr:cytochrome P450 [Poronia punctata]
MHEAFSTVLGDSIFSTDGKRWLENKNLLRPHTYSKDEPALTDQTAFTISSLQRRRDFFGPDHDQSRPERWDTCTPDLWHYIPFNHGPRICLGRNFGQFEMAYTIVRLIQQFDKLEMGDAAGPRVKIKVELNTKMAGPIMCRFYRYCV